MDGDVTAPVADDREVAEIARSVTGDPSALLLDWAATPIPHVGIIDTTGGLHLVVGRVRSRDADVSWSCVLKVLKSSPYDECRDPGSWCYWRREPAFYGSEVATELAGPLRPPRPHGVVERDDEAHVWMEHVSASSRDWRPEDFRRAGRAAGLSAGEFLAGRPLPDEPWLARSFLRSLLADGGFWATTMHPETGEAWRSPLVARFGAGIRERVLGVWADRDALLTIMDALPRVFGHGDLHPRNILLPPGVDDVVAVDWGFCGPSPLGSDLADLVFGPAWFCDIQVDEVPAVEQAASTAYLDGLVAAGWDAQPQLLRLGYAIAVGLRTGACVPGWAHLLLAPEEAPSSEVLFRRPVDAILDVWIELTGIALDRADEARTLARELGLWPASH